MASSHTTVKAPKPRVRRSALKVAQAAVSAPSLLRSGTDKAFQKLIFDLFTIADRIERVRVHVASRAGISGPQYSLLRAVALLEGDEGVSIGVAAEHLQVTSTFVTAQSGLLARRGLLWKKEDATDRRISRLVLSPEGEDLVSQIIDEVRPINDLFFGALQKEEFDTLRAIMEKLVRSSRAAIISISADSTEAVLSTRDSRARGPRAT